MQELAAVRRREELREWLAAWLAGQDGRGRIVSRLVQARIVPMSDGQSGGADGADAEAARFLVRGLARSYRLQLVETDEPDLFLLQRKGGYELLVDTHDPNYWLCHSLEEGAGTERSDWIDRLLQGSPALEPAWLPSQFLEGVAGRGRWTGFTLAHGPGRGDAAPGSQEPITSLRLEVAGQDVHTALQALRASGTFPHSLAVTDVEVEMADPEGYGPARLALGYRGVLTGRGNYRLHEALAGELVDEYRRYLDVLESQLAVGFVRQGRLLRLVGSPVNLVFTRRPSSLRALAEYLFSGRAPLHLWGVPIELGPSLMRARIVDLQGAGRLSCELGEDFLRLYVPRGSGGSLVARLYTLLQQHYDSSTAIGGLALGEVFGRRAATA